MRKAKTIEEGLIIVNEFRKTETRSVGNLLKRVEKKVFQDLCLMGYVRKGGSIIDNKATEIWTVTQIGKDEYEYKTKRIDFDESDLALLGFYNKY